MKLLCQYLSVILIGFFLITNISCSKSVGAGGTNNPPDSVQHPVAIDSVATMYVSGGRSPFLYALNAANGTIKWTATLGGNVFFSPAYSGGKIFVAATDQHVYAFDTLGNLSWSVPLSAGVASAPVAKNGILFISDTEMVYALDGNTGSTLWTFHHGASRLIVDESSIYFNSENNYLFAVDRATGSEKWEYANYSSYTPVLYDHKLFYMLGDYSMVELNSSDGKVVYNIMSQIVFYQAVSYNVNYGRIYVVIDASSAGLKVVDTSAAANFQYYVNFYSIFTFPGLTPILADSLVIFPFSVLNATTGDDVNANVLHAAQTTGLSYLNGIAYVNTSQKDDYDPYTGGHIYADIFALNIKTNQILWKTSVTNADFNYVEPCIVTKSGDAYVGANHYK